MPKSVNFRAILVEFRVFWLYQCYNGLSWLTVLCLNSIQTGTLEEIIDDSHAIVSTMVGSEYYVNILSFVDKDLLEPGCTVLLNHKMHAVVGVLSDDADPMVSVMKLEKAPQESYADVGMFICLYGV